MPFDPASSPTSVSPFRTLRHGRTGIELRHEDGLVYAFMLNPARTGVVDCRRPTETSKHDLHRAAARRFAERLAHADGLIWLPSAAA